MVLTLIANIKKNKKICTKDYHNTADFHNNLKD